MTILFLQPVCSESGKNKFYCFGWTSGLQLLCPVKREGVILLAYPSWISDKGTQDGKTFYLVFYFSVAVIISPFYEERKSESSVCKRIFICL